MYFNFSKECDNFFIGLLPIPSISFPLMSYEKTSLLVILFEIGIMYNIIKSIELCYDIKEMDVIL